MLTTERRALIWLADGDTGLSSQSILFAALGIAYRGRLPSDPSDLGRCLRLLRAIPELEPGWRAAVAERSSLWRCFLPFWDEMAASMEREVGIDWGKKKRATATYALMKRREADAYAATGEYEVERGPDGSLTSIRRRREAA